MLPICVFQKDTVGQYVLDKVCESLNLVEKDYFGLRYVDAEKQRVSESHFLYIAQNSGLQ